MGQFAVDPIRGTGTTGRGELDESAAGVPGGKAGRIDRLGGRTPTQTALRIPKMCVVRVRTICKCVSGSEMESTARLLLLVCLTYTQRRP